jgi:ABC-type enterochelin transport system substrate-binding protein
MRKQYFFLFCFIFTGFLSIYAQTTAAEPLRTFQSTMRRFAEIFKMVDLQKYNNARIDIKVANAEDLFTNNNDRYLIIAFPVPERNSYILSIYFRDAHINLGIIFDKSDFAYKLPDQLNEVFELYQDIAIIIWQSSGN